MNNSWIIRAIYPHGSHTVTQNDQPLRFTDRQQAMDRAEMLNATTRSMASRNMKVSDTAYIVVEDTI